MRLFASGLILIGMVFCLCVHAQQVEFEYSGRVRSAGVPFDGTGLFKFAIVSQDGTITYWTNDGTTQTNNEPTSSVAVTVSSGFFSIILGNTGLNGMAPLEASIFNTSDRPNLRIWFNDGQNGFQHLSPDRPIANASIIGLQESKVSTLYVNQATGNDKFPGTKPQHPKKTIQAAWNAIPPRILNNVEVQIAPGAYYELVTLSGKEALNDAQITLRGDIHSSNSVVISAAQDKTTSLTPSRKNAIYVRNQRSLRLEGLTLQQATHGAINIDAASEAQISKCQFHHSGFGIHVSQYSRASIDNVLVDDAPGGAFMVHGVNNENAYVEISDARLIGPGTSGSSFPATPIGVISNFNGISWITRVTIDNWRDGIHAKFSATINAVYGGNVVKNCMVGAHAVNNGTIAAALIADGRINYINNGQNLLAEQGGIIAD